MVVTQSQAMKRIYTHPNLALVAQVRSLIELTGIECALRNEYAVGAMGELAPISVWPEVWVVYDEDYGRALDAIQSSRRINPEPDWQCVGCASYNPATFETCWQCGGVQTT